MVQKNSASKILYLQWNRKLVPQLATPAVVLRNPFLSNLYQIEAVLFLFAWFLQSWPKVVGTLELCHVSPIAPNQCWKMSLLFNKKGKNHLIINIESGGRGELTLCPNSFVWDCRYIPCSMAEIPLQCWLWGWDIFKSLFFLMSGYLHTMPTFLSVACSWLENIKGGWETNPLASY